MQAICLIPESADPVASLASARELCADIYLWPAAGGRLALCLPGHYQPNEAVSLRERLR